jgi:hypothetical protein
VTWMVCTSEDCGISKFQRSQSSLESAAAPEQIQFGQSSDLFGISATKAASRQKWSVGKFCSGNAGLLSRYR